jgi:GTP-binding protein
VDRESATPERCAQVETQLFDLFASLGANDDQLNFHEGRLLYASAKQGWACTELPPR